MARPQRLKGWTTGGSRRAPVLLFGIFLLIGLGMLGGATYLVIDTRSDLAVGINADGTVIDLIDGQDSDGDTSYYPRVRFTTRSGEVVEFTGSVGSNPAAFDIGEPVAVIYDPAAPDDARINAFFQLWFGPLILGGLGIVFTAVGAFAAKARRSFPPPRAPMVTDSPAAPDDAPMVRTIERSARD